MSVIFPPACCVCGKINKNWICDNCMKRVNLKKVANIQKIDNKSYEKLLYIFDYRGVIRKLMLGYKFSNKAYISNFFANEILEDTNNCEILKNYDMIIPVPLHKKKLDKRGYNQTELVAEKIGRTLNIPVRNDIMSKEFNTITQSTLGYKSRQNNIQHAFVIKKDIEVEDKKIILLDDIFTTGATSEECSRILKIAGTQEILVLMLAKD